MMMVLDDRSVEGGSNCPKKAAKNWSIGLVYALYIDGQVMRLLFKFFLL
jgi:hypothetical protein